MTYLVVTIDTEEDNWANYDEKPAMSNIGRLVELQRCFDRYDVKPTYLITYPVATDQESIAILRNIHEDGRCEIGSHVHPWNTPPFHEEKTDEKNTMLCNLDEDILDRKIGSLHEMVRKNLRVEPVSFRSGRWGFDDKVAKCIVRYGYRFDTSVSPYMNWKKYHGPDYSNCSPDPYYLDPDGGKGTNSHLLEIPATIGFYQKNYERCNWVLNTIADSGLRHLRLIGLMDKLKLINKVMLSPETSDENQMSSLSRSIQRRGLLFLNMFFHSTTLQAGLTPFTKSVDDEKAFMKRLENFLEYVATNNIKSIRLSESAQFFPKDT